MPGIAPDDALRHIDAVLARADERIQAAVGRSRGTAYDWWQVMGPTDTAELESSMRSAFERYTVEGSPARRVYGDLIEKNGPLEGKNVAGLRGMLMALRREIEGGWLDDAQKVIRGEVLGVSLDRAEYLAANGFMPEASVGVRIVLEAHLRLLAKQFTIPLRTTEGRVSSAGWLNDQLQSKAAYGSSKTPHKQVTAWLSAGNDGAHPADESAMTEGEFSVLILGVRGFIEKYPA